MLKPVNLDDQSFGEIMARATERLPNLAPSWTDYNAHDPGITILELLAWYKEMQQYHLNFVGDRLKRRLLALAGVKPERERAARCLVELPPEAGYRAELARLETENGISLELDGGSAAPVTIKSVYLSGAGEDINIAHLIAQPDITVAPFSFGGESTKLNIGLEGGAPGDILRLWFEVADDLAVKRNPFTDPAQRPRELTYVFSAGASGPSAIAATPLRDDTHGLSQSGFVELTAPPGWNGGGVLTIALTDMGCEERVRIAGINAGRCAASQRETWSKLTALTVTPGARAAAALRDALSAEGELFGFLRTPDGLRHTALTRGADGIVYTDAQDAADDGEANLFIVSADALHARDLLFPSSGLPGMSIQLMLGGRRVLRDSLALICDTRGANGAARPEIWHYMEDLHAAGPKDCVFTLDEKNERLVFGNGENGALPPRGKNAVLLADFALSHCEGGNIPAGRARFAPDGFEIGHTAASGGVEAESVSAAAARLRRRIERSSKCASEEDYARATRGTPGLRVATARAIAGYDPDEPSGRSRIPVVTVVVAPYGMEDALPDARFLDAVKRHLEKLRPICTKLKVIGPRYVTVSISASVTARRAEGMREALRRAAEACFEPSGARGIGDPVLRGDLAAAIARVEGVYRVNRLELRRLDRDCYLTPGEDVVIPRNAIVRLADAEFEIALV
jgi:predicted phage baseplate assembly protein